MTSTPLQSTDPRTGISADTPVMPTTADEVAELAVRSAQAAPFLIEPGREHRATLLEAIANEIESCRDDLVAIADTETGLGTTRLTGEVSRSVFQFSMFAQVVRDGGYLAAAIDHAADSPAGPAPDVRRMLVPLGPIAVFGASNFPFAFSVLGGDTASALAAGCPVIAKAHGSHLLTSQRSFEVLQAALAATGLPADLIGIVYGQAAGTALVQHPAVAAAGFTGSLVAAQALIAAIGERDTPIPFFGELSSINPLVITPAAAAARTSAIAQGLFTSFTGSAGQLCTKPGIAFLPTGPAGDALLTELAELTGDAPAPVLLNERIMDSFGVISTRLEQAGARAVAEGSAGEGDGFRVPPTLLQTTASALNSELAQECFGPLIVVARYDHPAQVTEAFTRIPRSLTATVHAEDSDTRAGRRMAAHPAGRRRADRVQRVSHRGPGRLGPAPRRAVAGHQHRPHLRRGHRHRPLPAPGGMAERSGRAAAGRTARRLHPDSAAGRRRAGAGRGLTGLPLSSMDYAWTPPAHPPSGTPSW